MNAHDLLRLAPHAPALSAFSVSPAWVHAALTRAPFVVVRRTAPISDLLAVGVRGETRNERFAAWLDPRDVLDTISPESLRYTTPMAARSLLPAFALLQNIRDICDAFCDAVSTRSGFVWGPTGSVGFELASKHATVTTASDLDLLLRAPTRIAPPAAKILLDTLNRTAAKHDTRIDVQVETPVGAFSLAEYTAPGKHAWAGAIADASTSASASAASTRLMLRCADGPKLVVDPWEANAAGRTSETSKAP